MLYRLCEKLAGLPPAWFSAPHSDYQDWRRTSLASRLHTSTYRADMGAAREAHVTDCTRLSVMDRLLRSDMTPAAAVEYLDGPF